MIYSANDVDENDVLCRLGGVSTRCSNRHCGHWRWYGPGVQPRATFTTAAEQPALTDPPPPEGEGWKLVDKEDLFDDETGGDAWTREFTWHRPWDLDERPGYCGLAGKPEYPR